jgi:hypothetical protein
MGLTNSEKEFITENESRLDSILGVLESVKQFNLGDVLISFSQPSFMDTEPRLITNSYGVAKKYKVIHVDKYGVPYIKELNKKGEPSGNLIPVVHFARDRYGQLITSQNYIYEIDPDYTDAIILDNVDGYNASNNHKMKADLYKEITNHNKSIIIKFKTEQDAVKFISTLKPGDVLWRTHKTYLKVLNILPKRDPNTLRSDVEIEFQRENGAIVKMNTFDIYIKTFYSNAPRTYKELKDLK